MILLLAACEKKDETPLVTPHTAIPTDSAPTTTPEHTGGGAHTGVAGHTGTGPPGHTADTGPLDLADLVPGSWQPVSITQGGGTTPIPDDPARYLLLDASGTAALGCGTAPIGTWVFDPYGPYPSIGIIRVDLGFPLEWYVLTLDATTLVYVEGGDQFDFVRSSCP